MSGIKRTDFCVVGGDSGGVHLAFMLASFGARVALIEARDLEEITRSDVFVNNVVLKRAATFKSVAASAKTFGVSYGRTSFKYAGLKKQLGKVHDFLKVKDVGKALKEAGVDVMHVPPRFVDKNTVKVGNTKIRARKFILCRPCIPDLPDIDGIGSVKCYDYYTVSKLRSVPARLLIWGGDRFAVERAQAFARLGSNVTLIEDSPRFLPDVDEQCAAILRRKFEQEGINIIDGVTVTKVGKSGKSGISLTYEDNVYGKKHHVNGTHFLVCKGGIAGTRSLDLDAAEIEHDRGTPQVDERMLTTNPKVLAIGFGQNMPQSDGNTAYMLDYLVRQLLFYLPSRTVHYLIPRTYLTSPEVAEAGFNEEAAKEKFKNIRVITYEMSLNDRAVAEDQITGLCKVVVTAFGRVIGVSLIAPGASEMLPPFQIAIYKNMKVKEFLNLPLIYPSYGYSLRQIGESYAHRTSIPILKRVIKAIRFFTG